jgi:hypothetical protein
MQTSLTADSSHLVFMVCSVVLLYSIILFVCRVLISIHDVVHGVVFLLCR